MKSVIYVALLVSFVAAQAPPSNSYLPPPPSRGYPQAQPQVPQIIAARALDQGVGANAVARSQPSGVQANFNGDTGYSQNGAAARNGLDNSSPSVSYEADERGYKPQIANEDSENLNFRANNGYQGNDNNGGYARSTGY